MKLKKVIALGLAATLTVSFVGCGSESTTNTSTKDAADSGESASTDTASGDTSAEADTSAESNEASTDTKEYVGTTIHVYTHMGQRVLGEEKKDADGNTYRDEDTAILKQLAERFTEETGINVEFTITSDETELRPLFQVEDDGVDIFTSPNWTIEEWCTYAEPYMTLEEGVEEYGEYAYAMPNDGTDIYCVMPAKSYNQCVVYNEEVIQSVGYDEIPATLEEFNTMCQKIKDSGITPISMHRVENWPLATINDFAGYVAGDKDAFKKMLLSDTPFNEDEAFGKTMKIYTDWKAAGFFEQEVYTDFGVAMDSLAYGKAAMMLFGSWVVPQIQGRCPEGTDPSIIKFAPAPDFGEGRYVLGAPADNYAICKFSKNKEAAKMFIEYIASDAQYIADSGFIANKKGVDPIVPDLYAIIDDMVNDGSCQVLMQSANDENLTNVQNVLTEAGLWADYKYAGLLFDSLDVTKPDDWSAYETQVETENKAFAEAKEALGVSWIEE